MIENLKRGDAGAFKELVLQYQDKVINTCCGFVKNREDAEDVAQEVFIEVYRSIAGFREDATISTWLYRIAVTKSLDFIRKMKRKKRYGSILNIFVNEDQAERIPAPAGSNPETDFENQERVHVLQNAIDSLAESQKIAITLNKFDGFSYKEIAEIMGTTLSAVEALIHRAKKNLHKKLYHYYKKNF